MRPKSGSTERPRGSFNSFFYFCFCKREEFSSSRRFWRVCGPRTIGAQGIYWRRHDTTSRSSGVEGEGIIRPASSCGGGGRAPLRLRGKAASRTGRSGRRTIVRHAQHTKRTGDFFFFFEGPLSQSRPTRTNRSRSLREKQTVRHTI